MSQKDCYFNTNKLKLTFWEHNIYDGLADSPKKYPYKFFAYILFKHF